MKWLGEGPWAPLALFLLAAIAVVLWSWGSYDADFIQGIKVEAHGMLLDILVLGVLLELFRRLGRNVLRSDMYLDEINDLRGSHDDSAARRIAGLVHRLNKLGKRPEDLSNCHLERVVLDGANLEGCVFVGARLSECGLMKANLKGANFGGAVLEGAWLTQADLQGAQFRGANLRGSKFMKSDLTGADFRGPHTILDGASFEDAILDGANFVGTDLKPRVLEMAKSFDGAKFD